MNTFLINIELNDGKDTVINKEVYRGDYTPGDLHTVCDCVAAAVDKATGVEEIIEQINKLVERIGFNTRFEIGRIRFSFIRADMSIINEVDINSVKEIAFTNDIVTNFCLV